MRRSYNYQEATIYEEDSKSSIDEYIEHVARMQRMPSVIAEYPNGLNIHNNKNDNTHAPKIEKKVHFIEREKTTTTEINNDGKHNVYEEKSIDVEADGFIEQTHKKFEMTKWDTFKVY